MPSGTLAALFHLRIRSNLRTLAISHSHFAIRACASRVFPWVLRGGSGSLFENVIEPATRRGRTG